jgi:hypothetical protein
VGTGAAVPVAVAVTVVTGQAHSIRSVAVRSCEEVSTIGD